MYSTRAHGPHPSELQPQHDPEFNKTNIFQVGKVDRQAVYLDFSYHFANNEKTKKTDPI